MRSKSLDPKLLSLDHLLSGRLVLWLRVRFTRSHRYCCLVKQKTQFYFGRTHHKLWLCRKFNKNIIYVLCKQQLLHCSREQWRIKKNCSKPERERASFRWKKREATSSLNIDHLLIILDLLSRAMKKNMTGKTRKIQVDPVK
jgi:hypothetical protein